MKKKLEFSNDDYRIGQRALFEKVVEVVNYNIEIETGGNGELAEDSVGIAELSEKQIKAPLWTKWQALAALEELSDTATKKDIVDAYNKLIKAIKA